MLLSAKIVWDHALEGGIVIDDERRRLMVAAALDRIT
jgi:hypothetical protein